MIFFLKLRTLPYTLGGKRIQKIVFTGNFDQCACLLFGSARKVMTVSDTGHVHLAHPAGKQPCLLVRMCCCRWQITINCLS